MKLSFSPYLGIQGMLTTHPKCVILFSFPNTITVRRRSPVLHLYHFLYCIFSHFLCSNPTTIPQRYMFLNLMAWNENNKMQLCILCYVVHFRSFICQTIKLQHQNFLILNAIDKSIQFENRSSGTLTNRNCGFSLDLWYFINILNTFITWCNVECIYSLEPNKLQIIHLNYELAEF